MLHTKPNVVAGFSFLLLYILICPYSTLQVVAGDLYSVFGHVLKHRCLVNKPTATIGQVNDMLDGLHGSREKK
jgi:hypothetical protein